MGKRNATCGDCGGPQPNGGAARCRSCHNASRTPLNRGTCWWGVCSEPEYVMKYGLCHVHYDRMMRQTNMDAPVRGRSKHKRGVTPCTVEGCSRKTFSGTTGFCAMHHSRSRLHGGDPGQADPLPTGDSTRWHLDKFGYIRRRSWDADGKRGKWETQHRLVMAEILGRPLAKHENVHHINGVRHDNRPENLELWVKPQPAGQRPSDLVEWVVAEYPELVEAALAQRRQLRLIV